MELLNAAFLGIVEGLTEFLPVSSTGHLILFVDLLKFQGPPGHVFEVVIQLGAILAILVVYWQKLLMVAIELPSAKPAQHFVRNILLAFLPAAVIGLIAHDAIKAYLFNPVTVAWALIVGGIAILLIEKYKPEPTIASTEAMGWKTALTIGLIQCVSMIPGTSRSGATIMGALMCRVDRKTAAEFSFFLAIPTMLAATVLDLYKARDELSAQGMGEIAVGFVVSFVVALMVVRWLVKFVQTHGFSVFAWYRILVGAVILALA
ncbi:MAG: undecaprenyl-diphosphate phosphatase [Rickettsiales bacterium]